MREAKEGEAIIKVPLETKLTKKLPIFYNPVMKLNRDLSIALLKSIPDEKMQICDPLAGSGIRTIRFIKELPQNKIKHIYVNDYREHFEKEMNSELKRNSITEKVIISNEGAVAFMDKLNGFDYCDIDPFGSPNPFLDMAMKRIARKGILAVTATDTSALCGTYPDVCKRKYWATPIRNELMHEVGLRILIRKVQLIGVQYDKACYPIFSYSKDHYMRIFFRCYKSKKKCDELLTKHGMFAEAGPMWLGSWSDQKLVKKMLSHTEGESKKLLEQINTELDVDTIGIYDIHQMSENMKLPQIPRNEVLFEKVKKKGYKITNTHFRKTAVRTDMPIKEFEKIMKN